MENKTIPIEAALLAEWKHRLGLDDWVIDLEANSSPERMVIKECCGCTLWEESTKSAQIQIINPDLLAELVRPFDFEETLVHELLHIKTSLLSKKAQGSQEDIQKSGNEESLRDRVLHQIIDDLSRALVDAKKSGVKKNEPTKSTRAPKNRA